MRGEIKHQAQLRTHDDCVAHSPRLTLTDTNKRHAMIQANKGISCQNKGKIQVKTKNKCMYKIMNMQKKNNKKQKKNLTGKVSGTPDQMNSTQFS